jgi:hypothetical protein
MRELEEFRGRHEGEEVIVVGNGTGLKNIPFAFLESRPIFVMNYFSYWVRFIKPDYWLALDPLCFKGAEYVEDSIKFIKAHHANRFVGYEDNNLVLYKMMDKIPGFQWNKHWGLRYSTSAIAAAHLGIEMGAKRVLFVGIDCTHGIGGYQDIEDFKGVSRIPHFYDGRFHFIGYADQWDEHFGIFAKWAAEEHGAELVNLSVPTKCTTLERGDYRDYWEPEEV